MTNIRPLSSELQKVSENELNEIPLRVGEDLQHLKEWLKKQPHLNARTDDQWLVGFLRGCKFSLSRAQEKLDCFYSPRTSISEIFEDRNPFSHEIQELLKAGAIVPLPKTNGQAGPRIILIRWNVCDPETMALSTIVKVLFMLYDIMLLEDDNFVVSGYYILADFKLFNLAYILQYTPSRIWNILTLQNAYPMRVKGIRCTNAPPAFAAVFNIIKKLTSGKLNARIEMYSEANHHQAFTNIPLALFPKEFGGDECSIDILAAEWKSKVESYSDWFLEDSKYYCKDQLRQQKFNDSGEAFCMNGTFRKLSID